MSWLKVGDEAVIWMCHKLYLVVGRRSCCEFHSPLAEGNSNQHIFGLSGVGLLVIRTQNGGISQVGGEEACSPYHKVDGSVS